MKWPGIASFRRLRKNCSGLTLIEVLMALAIMGIGVSALVAASSRCLAIVRQSKNYENARRLIGEAEFKMQEYLLKEKGDVAEKRESWTFKAPFDGYTGAWELKKSSADIEEYEGLWEYTLTVEWAEKASRGREQVGGYYYLPETVKL